MSGKARITKKERLYAELVAFTRAEIAAEKSVVIDHLVDWMATSLLSHNRWNKDKFSIVDQAWPRKGSSDTSRRGFFRVMDLIQRPFLHVRKGSLKDYDPAAIVPDLQDLWDVTDDKLVELLESNFDLSTPVDCAYDFLNDLNKDSCGPRAYVEIFCELPLRDGVIMEAMIAWCREAEDCVDSFRHLYGIEEALLHFPGANAKGKWLEESLGL